MIGNFHSRNGVRTSVIFHSSLKCPEMIQSKSEWKFPFILYFSTVMASLGYLVSLVTILIEETPARYNDLLSVVSLRLFGNTDWTRGWFIYFSSITQWNSPIIWTLPTYIVFCGPFDPETPCHKWNIPEKRNGLEVPCLILNTQRTNNRGELDELFLTVPPYWEKSILFSSLSRAMSLAVVRSSYCLCTKIFFTLNVWMWS